MKKLLIAALLVAALPRIAEAQVEKQVEVTKAYVPSLESAEKLSIAPDMTDTVRMRPEIDYTVTPLSLRTTLSTRPIRPATVTYWEFNRPLPFYLKVGAGYPLNSVLDFYAASQNPGTGYVVGYLNHEGRYADIANVFGVKNNSVRMSNRVGAAAGKYFGRHVLEGDLNYENRLYHRYGAFDAASGSADSELSASLFTPGSVVDYGDANVKVRFGDAFQDLSRTNFEVTLGGGLFFDHSDAPQYNNKARQSAFEVGARIARAFGRHTLSAEAGYERQAGQKALSDYNRQQIHAALRYGVSGGVVRMEAGADYYHDKTKGAESGNYVIPFARLDFNLGTQGLRPFVELDGGVRDNGFRSLTRQNPYVVNAAWLDRSSVDYNGRFGVGGNLWRDRFRYRLYAAFSIRDNHLYWVGSDVGWSATADPEPVYWSGAFRPVMARQTATSFNGEIEYRPVSQLRFELGVHGTVYNDDTPLENGSPKFEGNLGIRYEGRKIAFGISARLQSERTWSLFEADPTELPEGAVETFTAPLAVDLGVDFEWKISGRISVLAQGRNLADRRLYRFACYPEYGANFTAGVKLNF